MTPLFSLNFPLQVLINNLAQMHNENPEPMTQALAQSGLPTRQMHPAAI